MEDGVTIAICLREAGKAKRERSVESFPGTYDMTG